MPGRSGASLTLLFLLAARAARAHIVPVPPSTCEFEPIEIDAPDQGISATATPAGAADEFRIQYDPQASQAQFNASTATPRSFTADGVAGTLGLPPVFGARLLNSGDLITSVPLAFTLGGTAASLTMTLTTGLAAAGGVVVEGAPIGGDGRFVMVGAAAESGLGPPLGGALAVRLVCQARPRPDTDQFMQATQTKLISGLLTPRVLKLRAIFAPGAAEAPDFAAYPAIVRAHAGDSVIAAVSLAGGLPARGRHVFVGHSADGVVAIGVRILRRNPVTYVLGLRLRDPTPPPSSSSQVAVTFTYEVGGLLSRATASFRSNRRATRLHFP